MKYHLISNLFGSNGCLDLDGDEESIHIGRKVYDSMNAAGRAAESLGEKYPNAYVDIWAASTPEALKEEGYYFDD